MRRYLVLIPALFSVLVISGCIQQTIPETLSWCVAGGTWSVNPSPSSEIVGVTTYGGQLRCHITLTALGDNDDGITINFYALDEEGNDTWITMTHPEIGTVTAHIVNNECVEGECEYFVATTSTIQESS